MRLRTYKGDGDFLKKTKEVKPYDVKFFNIASSLPHAAFCSRPSNMKTYFATVVMARNKLRMRLLSEAQTGLTNV